MGQAGRLHLHPHPHLLSLLGDKVKEELLAAARTGCVSGAVGGGGTRRCQWLRRKDARVCGRQGCGPGGPVRGRLDLQAPRALPPARGWEGYGASWQPAALGKPVRGEAKPQGPLANAADLKKRVTRQLDCCPPRLPPARGNYLTGSSPLPPEARQTNRIQSPH